MNGRGVTVLAVAAVSAGAAGGGWAFTHGPFARTADAAQSAQAVPISTAVVTSGTITASQDDAGTVGYAGSAAVYAQVAGTVTWLPDPGTVIRPGAGLFSVDDSATVLMAGHTPAWRAFSPGMTDGRDVAELQRNLIALGYDPYRAITPDGSYDWATQAAVRRWQASRGWLQDAILPLGQVVFLPGPVRVAAAQTGPGAAVAAGSQMLTVTSTTPVVTVTMPAQQAPAARAGQQVMVTLPDGAHAPGRVTGVSITSAASNSSSSAGASNASSNQGNTQPSVVLTIAVRAPAADNGALVQVAIATQTQRDALIVPISALLARPGGGYQVTVVGSNDSNGSNRNHNVTVRPGLFDDLGGNVAITGPGITAGTRVEVPAT
jgi:peptidoglycan hydrolase-like protein with peptidoglycan-binding domain